jgi:hypothetical protein
MNRYVMPVLALLLAPAAAHAAPVQWKSADGGNDHYYEFILAPNVKWTDAKVAAEQKTFDGVNGYLATATSAGESDFLGANFPGQAGTVQNAWLGGYQDHNAPDFAEPAGGWRWVTGEPFVYTNWFNYLPLQPDNDGGNQDYIRSNVYFLWDDFYNDPSNPSLQYVSGYLVEYPVPEPTSLGLIALALCARPRRRRTH